MVQHLIHGAAGLDHLVGRQALAQQVVARNRAVGQIDVRRVVHDAAVGFFRHALVKAAVAGLHVENRYLAPLGGYDRQTAVGVTQHQHGLGLNIGKNSVHCGNQVADGVGRTAAAFGTVEKIIRLAHAQIVKKHLVQFVVVILARVHQHVVAIPVQRSQHTREPNDFRSCTHDRQDFEFFHAWSIKKPYGDAVAIRSFPRLHGSRVCVGQALFST